VVAYRAHADIGLFKDLAANGIFEAFARLHKSCDCRVASLGPAFLTPQQAPITVSDEDDDRRVCAWKYLLVAVGITATPYIASGLGLRRRTAFRTVQRGVMPERDGASMGGEVGLVGGEHRPEKTQVLELTEFRERWIQVAADRHGEGRLVAEQSEEYNVLFVDERIDLRSLKQDGTGRITADQAEIAPDRDETCFLAYNCFAKPIGILAAVTAAIDECACKNIVIFQNSTPVLRPDTRRQPRRYPTTMPYPRISVLLLRQQVANFGQQYFFS